MIRKKMNFRKQEKCITVWQGRHILERVEYKRHVEAIYILVQMI